jgi:RNA polymerase sigma factor (sigma-70 family)
MFLAGCFHLYLSAFAMLSSTHDAASDELLMQAYASGDVRAFESLYKRHRGAFWRYLTRLIGSSAEGEELFQDAWQRVMTARDSFASQNSNFKAWLYRIGHNLALDRIRHRSIAPEASMDDSVLQFPSDGEAEPEHLALTTEAHSHLLKALDQLPAEQREVVLLRAEGELTLEEIGQLLGMGRETIKSRLRYALAKLKQGLADQATKRSNSADHATAMPSLGAS